MQKNRKILPKAIQTRLSSNEATARNRKPLLSKKIENPSKNALSNNKFNPSKSGPSKNVQSSQRKVPSLQKPAKEYKVSDFAEKSENVSTSSTTNTEREIADAVYLLKKEISEWRAQVSSRSRDGETEQLIASLERQVENEIYEGEINSRQEEFETRCVQSDRNGTNGSAIISTYTHQCDSGRSKKTEESSNEFNPLELPLQKKIQEAAVENEKFSRSTLPIPNIPFSIRNNPTMNKSTYKETSLTEKISSPPNSPILSPETTHVLENAEKLVENAQKKIIEINQNILLHTTNPEIPESQPIMDEDLLHLRQIVASRFQQANNPSKVHNASDHNTFTNSVQQVPENENTKTPRLLKLITMLPERYRLETKDEDSCCKTMPYYAERKVLLTDSIPNRFHTSHKVQNESSTDRNEKAAQTDENDKKPKSSTFQIQTGPRVIIKRSLQIQNVESLHISPESSVNQPTNVGIYNFQYEASSEKNGISQDCIIIEDDRQDNKLLEGRTAEKKQMFRKSVVIKTADELKLHSRKNSEKSVEKLSETDNFSRDKDELIVQSPREIIAANSTKSPKQCNIENAKANAFSEFLSSLNKDLDYSIASNKVEDSGEIKTNFETLDAGEKSPFEKVKENLINTNDEIKNADFKSEKLRDKATIISNERVNLKYKDILRGHALNPSISKPFFQLDKNSRDLEIEIDDINLKQPSVVDLDTILKRNDEIINNVVHDTDTLLKIISSKLETYNNVINEDNKIDQNVEFSSVKMSKPPEKHTAEKETDLKFYQASDEILEHIISGTNKFSKFIAARSEINDSVISQESVINTQSVNLSSASLSLISSTKNPVSQKPIYLEIKESPASSNNQSANELKDFSIKNSSEERKSELSVPSSVKSSKNTSEEKKKESDKIDEEGEYIESLLMQNNSFDNFERREDREFPNNLENQSSNSEQGDANGKNVALKPLWNSDLSSNIHNINYSGPSLQIKENDFSEMEIFGHIFESLRHSSAALKRFITCLFGETEARIENEIIGILRETAVHPTIINKFLLILQRRDKDSQLPIFTTNIGLYLSLSDDSRDSFTLRNQFQDFLEGKSKTFSLDSEADIKLSDGNTSNENEKNDNVTKEDKKDICDDGTLAVTQKKIDLNEPQEGNQELTVENGGFSLESQAKVENVLDETDKNSNVNSLQESQGKNENLNKTEIKSSSSSDIRLIESGPSVSDSSKRIDYSQNFTDSSSTSKDCKSLESHVSLKLSDLFMSKNEDNKETIPERSDELEIQRKIDDLLNRGKRVAQSVEKSIKTEIDNLTNKRSSEKSLRRKPLIRGKTFIIKKSSKLDPSTKVPEESFSVASNSMSDSQKGSDLRMRSEASESSGKTVESSTGTHSEGEIYLPSSCSYSLGEIKLSQQEKLRLREASEGTNSSKTVFRDKKRNSRSSSSHSLTRSLGEVYDSL